MSPARNDRQVALDGKPTLEAVAAVAGVSRATASRVVNDSPTVRPEARAAVERAIRKLGYVPNRAARSLVTRRTDSIALVVSEPESRIFAHPYFAGIVRGITQALAETDMQLVLVMAQTPGDRKRLERYFRQGHVDGALLISVHDDDPLPDQIVRAGTPVVLGGRPTTPIDATYVDVDNANGTRAAITHLVERGRRHIATIAGPMDMSAGVDRLEGFRAAMRDAGLETNSTMTTFGDFTEQSGFTCMTELLNRGQQIDGLFAASDLMAAGAVRALKASGRRVPDDVAVVGFDDEITALYTEPKLTTVRQPVDLMGRQMTALLLEQIEDPSAPQRAVILATELIVRDST